MQLNQKANKAKQNASKLAGLANARHCLQRYAFQGRS